MTLRPRTTPAQWLVVVTIGVVASFLGANIYSQHSAATIDEQAQSISGNAAPSIGALTSARGALRRLTVATAYAVSQSATGQPFDRGFVDASLEQLKSALAAYFALPYYPEEVPLSGQVKSSANQLDRAVAALLEKQDSAASSRAAQAREISVLIEQVDATVEKLVAVNVSHATELGLEIARARRRVARVSYALHAVAAGLALLLMALSVRAARQQLRLTDERNRLTEQRAEELELFAGRVAHDIKNPLGALALRVSAAQRQAGDGQARETLSRIGELTARINRIIDALLDFARAGGKPQPGERAPVGEVLAELAAELGPEIAELSAELRIESAPPLSVACSPGALTSVIGNLLRNAVKYIGDARCPVKRITVRVIDRAEWVRVEVEDSGPGIPPGQELAIFEPYVRLPGSWQPGIGLGLATVRRIVAGCGGRVGVESTPDRGSCFWVELPKAAANSTLISPPAPALLK